MDEEPLGICELNIVPLGVTQPEVAISQRGVDTKKGTSGLVYSCEAVLAVEDQCGLQNAVA